MRERDVRDGGVQHLHEGRPRDSRRDYPGIEPEVSSSAPLALR
jgi:hypothetical protein